MMKIIRLILVMMTVGLMTGCVPLPRIYLGADDVYGTVVDEETKKPLQGVNVLEIWEQYDGYYANYSANLVLNETVTNDKGYYSFDGWGPRFTMNGYLRDSSPALIFYKYGYEGKRISNSIPGRFISTSYKYSEWSGKTIELKKFVGTAIDYSKATSWLDGFLHYDSWYRGCDWKRVPQYTAAMIKLNISLGQDRGWGPSNFTLDRLKSSGSRCGFNPGEVEKFLGKYLNEK